MENLTAFFTQNMAILFFFYGLAFFSMGLTVWLESDLRSQFRLTRNMHFLAGFGLIHGIHEWIEMAIKLMSPVAKTEWLLLMDLLSLVTLVASFILLVVFGSSLIYAHEHAPVWLQKWSKWPQWSNPKVITTSLILLWGVTILFIKQWFGFTTADYITAIDVITRYTLGIPGALLVATAMLFERSAYQNQKQGMALVGRLLPWLALTFFLYGAIGQLFTKPLPLFPANLINSTLFLTLFGLPVQLFRGVMAVVMAVLMVHILRILELGRQEQLLLSFTESLARAELRSRTLHETVAVQERERQRISRELHDGAGQILTALGLGLAAVQGNLQPQPALAQRQLSEMQQLSNQAMLELHNVITDLRPTLLDDFGLVTALETQLQGLRRRTATQLTLHTSGSPQRLEADLETVAFRIVQELLTNVIKHAQATAATVDIIFSDINIQIEVRDNGRGFAVEEALALWSPAPRRAWGLLGIQERTSLAGGRCEFQSAVGVGSCVHLCLPLKPSNAPCTCEESKELFYAEN